MKCVERDQTFWVGSGHESALEFLSLYNLCYTMYQVLVYMETQNFIVI